MGLGAKNAYSGLIEIDSQIVGYLSTCGDDDTVRLFKVDDVQHSLEGEFIEVEAVAHVIIGGNGLRVIVDHDGTIALTTDGVQCLNATPVELHTGADAIGTRAKHDDRTRIVLIYDVVTGRAVLASPLIGEIQVVGLSRILSRQRVNLLHDRQDAVAFAQRTNLQQSGMHVSALVFESDGSRNLKVGESVYLGFEQERRADGRFAFLAFQSLVYVDDMLQFVEEPLVDLGEFMNTVDGVGRLVHSLRYDKDTLVGRLTQGCIDVGNRQFLVLHKAVHALPYHAQAFLNGLFEGAPDGHHLADRLHRTAQFLVDTVELGQIPARNLAHDIVECRLEEGRGGLGDGIVQFEQPVAQSQLCRHKCQRIARGFRCQGRRTRQAGIDLYHTIVFRLRVEGILHIALAHNTYVPDDLDGKSTQLVILRVGQRLRRSNHDALARMNAEGIEVLHVTDRDTVVVAVAHYLILYLFPPFERLFDQHLRREGKGFLAQRIELFFVVAEARTESAEGVCSTNDDRIAQVPGCLSCLFHRFASLALDGAYVDFIEFPDKKLAVFGVHDGLNGRSEHTHTIFFKNAALVEFNATVQCGLPAKGQQYPVGTFLLDDPFYEIGLNRKEINLVGHSL